MYYNLAFRQNFLNVWDYYRKRKTKNYVMKLTDTDLCRFCKKEKENIEHILTKCNELDYSMLREECQRYKVIFDHKNLVTNVKLKYEVERFLYKNFC